MKKVAFYISLVLMVIGCGSGDSLSDSSNTDDTTTNVETVSKLLKGFYVDEPVTNVEYICGQHSGTTDAQGTFFFEDGEDCEFRVADILLEHIDASELSDGITIFENNLKVASFLQSLDSSSDSKVLKIDDKTKEALKELDINQIPQDIDSLVVELNKKLQTSNIKLKAITKQEALSYLTTSYSNYKNKHHILTDKTQTLDNNKHQTPTKENIPTDSSDIPKVDTPTNSNETQTNTPIEQVDSDDETQVMDDSSSTDDDSSVSSQDIQALVGDWNGSANYIDISLVLKKDGTYKYHSRLGIGKYHNYYRYSDYEGKWSLQKGNSQIVLELPNVDAPLVLTNKFPKIETPAGVELSSSNIDTSYKMSIDQSKNIVKASYTKKAQEYMSRDTADFTVDYFTMVAPKANSEAFWSSANVKPMGYNYGHKLGLGSDDWNYAMQRIKDDPQNYTMVISDENWQTMLGNRHEYMKVIQEPTKVYKWFEYFKDQMQILGKVDGTVLYIIAGDAPPFWASDIREKYDNDPKTAIGKIIESRFPEVLERNPSNSWAGIFQMMDYLRMKYAPNVKLGYTLKTWGIAEKDIYHEPENGWDNADSVKVMAEYLNNYDVQFDFLSFNFHPRSSHTTEEYESAAKYFGAISKLLNTRDNTEPKLWIWKSSLWNKEQPKFYFTHIDFMVHECNAIGMTLGHGNDLSGKSGFSDDVDNGIYVKSWIDEYYNHKSIDSIPTHATKGVINWR